MSKKKSVLNSATKQQAIVWIQEVETCSQIECSEKHKAELLLREAAIRMSEGRSLGLCCRCGKEFRYIVRHVYANDHSPSPKEWKFEVVKVVRLKNRLSENYDPFLLVLRAENGEKEVLPVFWAEGKGEKWLWGQFSPLLSLAEWDELFGKVK